MSFVILCVVTLGGLAWYVMEPWERARVVAWVIARLRQAFDLAVRMRASREPLHDVLRARTPFPLVTPALVGASLALSYGLLTGDADAGDPATLVHWGASYGPQTTNGEWWRLVTSTFVYSGVLHLAVNLAALISVGLVLERLVGYLTFAGVYCAAAACGGVAAISTSAVSVVAGGSAAIFGLYGLLLASWAWGACQHATTTIRLRTVTRLVPAAGIFVLYHAAEGGALVIADQVGLVTGFACGLVLARCVRDSKPPARRVAITVGLMASIAFVTAVPLRGMTDINPEMEQLIALEARLSRSYDAAVDDFKRGYVTRKALADLIEDTIVPDLRRQASRVEALDRVPAEHQPMLAAAETYLRLRDKGWRLRAAALRQASSGTSMLREADKLERASLDALERLKR